MKTDNGRLKRAMGFDSSMRSLLTASAAAWVALLWPQISHAQVPGFWSASSGYGSSCTGCHSTPPIINATADSRAGNTFLDATTSTVQTLGNFKSFFNTFARPNGSPMTTFCGGTPTENCTWPFGDTDVELLRQYVMDVVDMRVTASGGTAGIFGSPVQSNTSTSSTATVNFGRVANGGTSPSVTFTVQNWRATAMTLSAPLRSGGNASNFNLGIRSCNTLPANHTGTCSFTVSFSASTTGGFKTTTLQIPFAIQVAGDTVPATRYITLNGSTNNIPVANAGTTQSITAPRLVNLGGSATDADGDSLTYSWTLTSRPVGSAAVLSSTTIAGPSFTADKAGTYTASLAVSDGFNSSTASVVTINAGNTAPVANAGTNQSITAPRTVNLSGSGSSDPNGDTLTYAWTLTTRPASSAAALSSTTAVAPTFVADKAGTYVASLVVNDGTTNSTAAPVTITAGNTAPVANAGSNQSITAPATVNLSGAASSDANGDTLTYTWTLTARPSSSTATLSSTTAVAPTFAADKTGTYVATLVVNDGTTSSGASPVTINAGNTAPAANAGSNQSVLAGATVNLSGASSSDANGDALTYAWTLPTRPAGSTATLAGASSATPSFVADVAGTYVASLIVNDGTTNSTASAVTLTAASIPGFVLTGTPFNPSVQVGSNASTTLTVTNTGNAALVLSASAGLAVTGSSSAEYSLGGTCANGTSLAGTLASPRTSCTVVVSFTPTATGVRAATLTIRHNDNSSSGGVTVVSLDGVGTDLQSPQLDVGSGAPLSFGNVVQGAASASQTITVRNGNTASNAFSLALNGVASSSADFALGGTCTASSSLGPNATCSVTVAFRPLAAGSRSGNLTISSSNAGSAIINLSGTAVALADATLSGVPLPAFPSTLTGTVSNTTGTVTINNPRANSITYAPAFGGADAGDFQFGSESCASRVVPGGGSCTLVVRFSPTAGAGNGTRSAALGVGFVGFGSDPAPATLTTPLSGVAALPTPAFGISSSSLSFTAVVLSPTTTSAVVTNTGTANLSLSGLSFSGAQASDFSLAGTNACTSTTTLTPSSSCTLVVRYDPAAAGSSSATLSITSNAASSPHSVALSGTATPTPRPRISLSSLALTYGSLQVGTPGSQSITVENAGDAPLNFSAFTLSGGAAADFTRSGTCALASALAPLAQCALTVTFNPSAAGSRSASLAVVSDASNGTASVSLTGTGVPVPAPVVTLSALSGLPLEFGSQTVNGLYPSRRVTLTNSGNADLVTSSVTVEGAGFSNASAAACPTTLVAGAACDIEIAFSPTAANTQFNGNVRVISNAAGSPHTAALHGTGVVTAVPSVVWLPLVSRLDFGQVNAGAVSAVQSATLRNNGPGGVRLTVLNAVGADSAAFSVTTGTCQMTDTLFEGQTCRIDISFAPATAGTKTARVQVASTGSFPTDLNLTGIGMGGPIPGLTMSVRTLALGNIRLGTQSVPAELTLSANGSGMVRVTALVTSAGFTVQPKSCPSLPFNLQAGSECTLTVVFTPTAAGAATGQLTVTSDASNGTNQQVALTGSGEAAPELSGGGCSISQGESAGKAVDPTLWLLVLMALVGLAYRHHLRQRAAARSAR